MAGKKGWLDDRGSIVNDCLLGVKHASFARMTCAITRLWMHYYRPDIRYVHLATFELHMYWWSLSINTFRNPFSKLIDVERLSFPRKRKPKSTKIYVLAYTAVFLLIAEGFGPHLIFGALLVMCPFKAWASRTALVIFWAEIIGILCHRRTIIVVPVGVSLSFLSHALLVHMSGTKITNIHNSLGRADFPFDIGLHAVLAPPFENRSVISYIQSGYTHICQKLQTYHQNVSKPYVYAPLHGHRTIRLFTATRTARGFQFKLKEVSLDTTPPFEAISYTWGDPTRSHELIIDGKCMPVTASVWELVHTRAKLSKSLVLWIDLICINQESNHERSAQVQLMGEIYGRACQVTICLGNSPDAIWTVSLLCELYERACSLRQDPSLAKNTALRLYNMLDSRYSALARFLSHSYFHRVWIIQEVALGTNVYLLYGDHWIEWSKVVLVVESLFPGAHFDAMGLGQLYQREHGPTGVQQIVTLNEIRSHLKAGNRFNLSRLLRTTALSDATDPHDKVYALLGLSLSNGAHDIVPNYDMTVSQTFTEAAIYCLLKENDLQILSYAGIAYDRTVADLPSWVPDWTCMPKFRCRWLNTRDENGFLFNASKRTTPHLQISRHQNLEVRGFQFDVIADTMKESISMRFCRGVIGWWFTGVVPVVPDLRDAVNFTLQLPTKYVTGVSKAEAIWRTLVMDTIHMPLPRTVQTIMTERGMSHRGTCWWRPAPKEVGADMMHDTVLSSKSVANPRVKEAESMADYNAEDAPVQTAIQTIFSELGEVPIYDRKCNLFHESCREQKLAISGKGYLGLVPKACQSGDIIAILYGLTMPFVLRPCGTESTSGNQVFKLVGECYVHGIMDGEALAEPHEEVGFVLC